MTQNPKAWEGQVVDGRFPLLRYLGGGECSAVFATLRDGQDPQKSAIKLVSTDPVNAELQLERWKAAANLSHPHLMRIYEMGRCRLDGAELIYVVTECADEDLAQVLPERPLSADEAQVVLEATSDVLAYLHGQGLVHGHVRPSNIMAAGDRLKLSSDRLCQANGITPADDVWALGMTLVQALTQRPDAPLPPGLPAPLVEITQRCLERNPVRRWTAGQIQVRLGQAAAPPQPRGMKRRISLPAVLLLALAAVVGVIVLVNRSPEDRRPDPTAVQAQHAEPVAAPKELAPEAAAPKTPEPEVAAPQPSEAELAKPQEEEPREETPVPATPAPNAPTPAAAAGSVLEQVMPEILPRARHSIQGRVKLAIKLRVDAAGAVADAQLSSPGPSRYFAGRALEAARQWKFKPARAGDQAVASAWLLRFEFSRSETKVRPEVVRE